MIYLIDDKKIRQKECGWSKDRFARYVEVITPLYTIGDVAGVSDSLYKEGNIILYHESFLDFTDDKRKASKQRKKLQEKAELTPALSLAFFSGSQGARSINNNIAYLPASRLYQNLEVLILKHKEGSNDLKYLLFGENPEIEVQLDEMLTEANLEIEKEAVNVSGNNLFIRPTQKFIQNAINGAKEEKIFIDVTDEKFSEKIADWLNNEEYDNIFIPLCFGPTLSDYNGLRLATHIRCTPTKNQLKRIFIYSFVGLEYLINHEYLGILKTKNIQLLPYKKKAFESASINMSPLRLEELPDELKKLKLDPPLNYTDSHSIANEWAIHQWAKTIGCDETEELKKVFKTIDSNLYFKYLKTIYPISDIEKIPSKNLEVKYEGKPKVLLIDDDADKGWFEIFAYLLGDINDLYLDYLGQGFKSQNSDDIIRQSMDKIKSDDIDIVILDFRLNSQDFENVGVDSITSVRLLKQIKEFNPGIQVIVFSATNKIWNLQTLQALGVDGFMMKEAPEHQYDSSFTTKGISTFISLFSETMEKLFLKELYKKLFEVGKNLARCDYEDGSKFETFLKELKSHVKIIDQSGRNVKPRTPTTIDIVFLTCFNFTEQFKNYYFEIAEKGHNEKKYQFSRLKDLVVFKYTYDKDTGIVEQQEEVITPKSESYRVHWFQGIIVLLVDHFKILEYNDPMIQMAFEIRELRNDYIHNKLGFISSSEILNIADLMVKITSAMKE